VSCRSSLSLSTAQCSRPAIHQLADPVRGAFVVIDRRGQKKFRLHLRRLGLHPFDVMFGQLGMIGRNPLAGDRELLAGTDRIRGLLRLTTTNERQP
jgi:hypothetical protein